MSSPVESLQPELILSILYFYEKWFVPLILALLKRYCVTKKSQCLIVDTNFDIILFFCCHFNDRTWFPDFQMTAVFAKLVFILDFYWPKKFSVSWIQSWRDAFFFFLWNWRFDKFGSWASKAFCSCGRIIGKNLCSCTVRECPKHSNWYDFLLIVDLKFVPPFQRKT